MSVLGEPEYQAVRREIEARAKFYSGQPGADVDWLLAQLRKYELARGITCCCRPSGKWSPR